MKTIFLLICLTSLTAFGAKGNKVLDIDKIGISTGTKTTIVESDKVRARVFTLKLGAVVEEKLDDNFSYFFDIEANFETGSNQATGNYSEYEPLDELNINDGGIEYHPAKFFNVKLGALNQNEHNSPLLLGGVTFAGIQEKLSLGAFYFKATQAIPSNSRLSRRVGGVNEETPQFYLETLGVKLGTKRFNFTTELSHFKFQGLSSDIALKSAEHGNSTTGIEESRSFNYNFEGYNLFSNVNYLSAGGVKLLASVQYLYNEKAPDDRNSGHLGTIGLGTKLATISITSFRNESDASVAIYNSKFYLHNNVEGAGVGYKYRTKKFDIKANYYRAQVIEENALQSDADIFVLELERFYEF